MSLVSSCSWSFGEGMGRIGLSDHRQRVRRLFQRPARCLPLGQRRNSRGPPLSHGKVMGRGLVTDGLSWRAS